MTGKGYYAHGRQWETQHYPELGEENSIVGTQWETQHQPELEEENSIVGTNPDTGTPSRGVEMRLCGGRSKIMEVLRGDEFLRYTFFSLTKNHR